MFPFSALSLSLSLTFSDSKYFFKRIVHFIRLQSQLLIFMSLVFFFLFSLSIPCVFLFAWAFFLCCGALVPLLTSIAISIYVIYYVIMQTRQEIKWDCTRVYLSFTWNIWKLLRFVCDDALFRFVWIITVHSVSWLGRKIKMQNMQRKWME